MRRVAFALVVACAGCATSRADAPASLVVRCNVPDAAVFVDDVFVGRAREWSDVHYVHPGFHRVELRDPGHYVHRAEVELAGGGGAIVEAELHPLLD
jgi:hypothetical protein